MDPLLGYFAFGFFNFNEVFCDKKKRFEEVPQFILELDLELNGSNMYDILIFCACGLI